MCWGWWRRCRGRCAGDGGGGCRGRCAEDGKEGVGEDVLGMMHLQRFSDDLTSQPVWPHEGDDS